jgi:hypothetical protein
MLSMYGIRGIKSKSQSMKFCFVSFLF